MASLCQLFTRAESNAVLSATKVGKAAGTDGMLPSFLKYLGLKRYNWMAALITEVITTSNLPTTWRHSKVIAILKPGKPPDYPKSYSPKSLLSTTYRLLEWTIMVRLQGRVKLL